MNNTPFTHVIAMQTIHDVCWDILPVLNAAYCGDVIQTIDFVGVRYYKASYPNTMSLISAIFKYREFKGMELIQVNFTDTKCGVNEIFELINEARSNFVVTKIHEAFAIEMKYRYSIIAKDISHVQNQ